MLVGGFLSGVLHTAVQEAAAQERTPKAAIRRSAPISKFSGIDEIVEACTTATSYVRMPGMVRSFTLGGAAAEEVVVMFQGAAMRVNGESFDTGFIRLLIDGQVQGVGGGDGQIPLKSPTPAGTSEAAAHGFTWQTRRLAPGLHTVQVQWRTDLGSEFCVDARSLLILHQ
jgi:hypothetical protein